MTIPKGLLNIKSALGLEGIHLDHCVGQHLYTGTNPSIADTKLWVYSAERVVNTQQAINAIFERFRIPLGTYREFMKQYFQILASDDMEGYFWVKTIKGPTQYLHVYLCLHSDYKVADMQFAIAGPIGHATISQAYKSLANAS